jgi:hypothetical protein
MISTKHSTQTSVNIILDDMDKIVNSVKKDLDVSNKKELDSPKPKPENKTLTQIINNTTKQPTIVNTDSSFIVITYWWGSNNQNQNIARPCLFFYEDFINKIIKKTVNTLLPVFNKKVLYGYYLKDIHNLNFNDIINKYCKNYLYDLMQYLELKPNCFPEKDFKDKVIKLKIDELKEKNMIDTNYTFVSSNYVYAILKFISVELIKNIKPNLELIVETTVEVNLLKNEFEKKTVHSKEWFGNGNLSELKKILVEKRKIIDNENLLIKKKLNTPFTYEIQKTEDKDKDKDDKDKDDKDKDDKDKDDKDKDKDKEKNELTKLFYDIYEKDIQNKSLFSILISTLKYKQSITYNKMIDEWEIECKKKNCNYLSIEYPEFAKPGGYQLAINAKPLFIQKALELCHPRNVVYIDGDMYIRKYPLIFDMKDIDYMARGWNIDPRSSYKFEDSISYDPYTFETSGGTMFFSQSLESKQLLHLWVSETNKPINHGKADDRIISLLFNSKKLLCNMKIIQLPIEYLWLTLNYNDYLLSPLYDYDEKLMNDSIIIEHSECLTSEETASGSGASNDRNPFMYDKFIENILDPVSEELYEYIFFPEEKFISTMKDYLKYMRNTFYYYDGNELLVEKGFVEPGRNHEENEQPLYVYNYGKKYNKNNHIHAQNIEKSEKVDLSKYKTNHLNILELKNISDDEMIPTLLKCIQENKPCICLQDHGHSSKIYLNFKYKYEIYKNLEFVYNPININTDKFNQLFYKCGINEKEPIFINTTKDSVLYKYLSMFSTLSDFSDYLIEHSYFFISLTRVGYFVKKNMQEGGTSQNSEVTKPSSISSINEYLTGLNDMYSKSKIPHKTIKKHKINKHKTRKH